MKGLLAWITRDDEAVAFVHIDNKAHLSQSLAAYMQDMDRVVLAERKSLNWGGWGLVGMALRGMKTLFNEYSVDYVFLLSDSHVPLLSSKDIKNAIESESCAPVMESGFLPDNYWGRLGFHFPCADRRTYNGLYTAIVVWIENRLLRFMPSPKANKYRYGSQWVGLSHNTFQGILKFMMRYPLIVLRLRFSLIPDEMFFQTMIGLLEEQPSHGKHTKMIWESGDSGPRELGLEELRSGRDQRYFFARKCNNNVFEIWMRTTFL